MKIMRKIVLFLNFILCLEIQEIIAQMSSEGYVSTANGTDKTHTHLMFHKSLSYKEEVWVETNIKLMNEIFMEFEYLELYYLEKYQNNPNIEAILRLLNIAGKYCLNIKMLRNDKYEVPKKSSSLKILKKSPKGFIMCVDYDSAKNIMQNWYNRSLINRGEDFVLILLMEPSKEDNKQLSHWAWKTFHFFNVFVVENSNDRWVKITIYNPYRAIDGDVQRCFQEYLLNENNVRREGKRIRKVIDSKAQNLQGFPLRITMHDFNGLSEPVFDDEGNLIRFKGSEGRVVAEYAKIMNFKPVYCLPRDGLAYGGETENGSLSGGLLDMEEGYSDLSGNYRIVLYQPFKNIKFLKSLVQSKLVIIVPKINEKHKTIKLILAVLDRSAQTVSLLFISLLVIAWTWFKIKELKHRYKKMIYECFIVVLMNCVRIIHFNSIILPKSKWEKIIFLSLSIWAFFVSNVYIGTIVTNLTLDKSFEIDTFEDLEKSDLMIANMISARDDLIFGIEDMSPEEAEIRRKLYARQFIFYDPVGVTRRLAHKKIYAMLCPDFVSRIYIDQYYTEEGEDMIYEMKQIVKWQYCAQMIPSNSPLGNTFDRAQDMLYQAGMFTHWKEEDKHNLLLGKMHRPMSTSVHPPLNLKNLRKIFVLWMVLMLLALIVFLIELLVADILYSPQYAY